MSAGTTITLDFFADHVINADKSPVERASLEGKTIGLYFSAHWCGPCRNFTPKLAERYTQILAAGHAFEVVFVSADESEEEALAYFESMPWKMLSFEQSELNAKLNEIFQVRGIPSLILLDKDGNLITDEGRAVLMSTEFENIPSFLAEKRAEEEILLKLIADLSASPAAVIDYLASMKILNKQGETVSAEELKSKQLVGLFFAASWSPASKNLTSKLVEKYNSFLADNKSFEIIFVSYDREPHLGLEFYAEMPWVMLNDSGDKTPQLVLQEVFSLTSFPMLVLLNANEILTEEGEEAVLDSKTFEQLLEFPALQKAAKEKELADFPSLPETITIAAHEHFLVKQEFVYNGRYGCDICGKGGAGCAYHCFECGFDGHIKCTLEAPKAAGEE